MAWPGSPQILVAFDKHRDYLTDMMTTTLVTPKTLLKSFILASDRAYWSKPVAVELLYSEISTRLLFVRDPQRGSTFPTNPKWIKEGGR